MAEPKLTPWQRAKLVLPPGFKPHHIIPRACCFAKLHDQEAWFAVPLEDRDPYLRNEHDRTLRIETFLAGPKHDTGAAFMRTLQPTHFATLIYATGPGIGTWFIFPPFPMGVLSRRGR